jgi:DNA-binding LacI/PurR family transcriptional regulator
MEGADSAWSIRQTFPQVTAICFASDMMAIAALYRFQRLGLNVPRDISLVGYDDIYATAFLNPSLTTIQRSHFFGTGIAELLLEMLQGKPGRRQRFAAQLISRESVSSAPNSNT